MEEDSDVIKGAEYIDLPPGFRFHPTDEEIITHYLTEKVLNCSFSARAIGEVDLNKCEPWHLPRKAEMEEKERYFFCQRDRKYPTGIRTNRATEAGYWKATGKDKEIYRGRTTLVGMKKTLVFYKGRAPKGEKTNWIMHEYRLEGKFTYYNFPKTAKEEWVVCRIFQKSTEIKKNPISGFFRMDSFGDEFDSSSMPPLLDPPCFTMNRQGPGFFEDGFKEIAAMRASDAFYLPFFSTAMEEQESQKGFGPYNHSHANQGNHCVQSQNPIFYPQNSHPNPLNTMQGSSNLGFLHHEGKKPGSLLSHSDFNHNHEPSLKRQQCKVEQCSNQQSLISVSQETALSTDINTEISSVVTKHELGSTSCEDPGDPSSGGPVDLDCLWDY